MIFWNPTLFSFVDKGRRFGSHVTSAFYPGDGSNRFLEILVPIYQIKRPHIPEDYNLNTDRLWNVQYSSIICIVQCSKGHNNSYDPEMWHRVVL
jgi:hypothetical protein